METRNAQWPRPVSRTGYYPTSETQETLFLGGYGTAPDRIYARGVSNTPSPDPNTFDRKKCSLILIEVGFCNDFGCHKRLQEKTTKYVPLVTPVKEA